jgi:hypothetical protein
MIVGSINHLLLLLAEMLWYVKTIIEDLVDIIFF